MGELELPPDSQRYYFVDSVGLEEVSGLLLPTKTGRYKYIIIEKDDELELIVDSLKTKYECIAVNFLNQEGENVGILKVLNNPESLGIKGSGILDWDFDKRTLIYHGNHDDSSSLFPSPEQSLIDNMMIGVDIYYETPLDSIDEAPLEDRL
jgi:hypothetical protein